MKLTFLGAVETVTGSKYLLEQGGRRLLVDCGLFQGYKKLRLRNWAPLPVAPHEIERVLLTHAHLDHSGYLPLLLRNGFAGPAHCTAATRDLCAILLPDSGYLQERDAEFANRHGFSKHHPAKPLYDEADADKAVKRLQEVAFDRPLDLGHGLTAHFHRAGHILGAAMIELEAEGCRVLFSGDLGRPNSATMPDPAHPRRTDYLVVESTYGDRKHDPRDPEEVLADIIIRTAARGGTVLIPSFAVGRAQTLLYHLHRLKRDRRIPNVPIVLDSPMAIDASETYCRHPDDHRLSAKAWQETCAGATYIHRAEESKKLDTAARRMPMVIISASGMATGGRVLHHLKTLANDPRNAILFAGFQAGGTRGAAIVGGAKEVKIHGGYVPINAEVHNLSMLSAHADADEILAWLSAFEAPPRMTFVTHGEPEASDRLRHRIEEELGWPACVPEYLDSVRLSPAGSEMEREEAAR